MAKESCETDGGREPDDAHEDPRRGHVRKAGAQRSQHHAHRRQLLLHQLRDSHQADRLDSPQGVEAAPRRFGGSVREDLHHCHEEDQHVQAQPARPVRTGAAGDARGELKAKGGLADHGHNPQHLRQVVWGERHDDAQAGHVQDDEEHRGDLEEDGVLDLVDAGTPPGPGAHHHQLCALLLDGRLLELLVGHTQGPELVVYEPGVLPRLPVRHVPDHVARVACKLREGVPYAAPGHRGALLGPLAVLADLLALELAVADAEEVLEGSQVQGEGLSVQCQDRRSLRADHDCGVPRLVVEERLLAKIWHYTCPWISREALDLHTVLDNPDAARLQDVEGVSGVALMADHLLVPELSLGHRCGDLPPLHS
mmetsp:Transcript_103562/g.302244  ORF Transcript_103562/g.302244 Transcript_103562/m.302244 type:complete len:367 (+) Transcript_103562:1247-2347(+)